MENMNRKNFLIILSLVVVVVFIFIIFKSYKIAKTRNKIDELPIIESNVELIKIKQETRELETETNSFYDNFKNNERDNTIINVVREEDDDEIKPLDDSVNLENKINKIVNNSAEYITKDNQVENIKEVIVNEKNEEEKKSLEDNDIKKNINDGNFYKAQLIALKNKQQAEIFVEKTRKRCGDILKGLELFITEINLDKKGIFYRVQVGKFNTKEEANNFCENYKRLSMSRDLISCIVVK